MFAGFMLIVFGIMIAVFPELLSIIVASVLILFGTALIFVGYRYKKIHRKPDSSFADFFFRF